MKNNHVLALIGIFVLAFGLTIFELIQLIAPYYSYSRGLQVLAIIALAIYGLSLNSKNSPESSELARRYKNLTQSLLRVSKNNIQNIGYISFLVFSLGVFLSIFLNLGDFFTVLVWSYFGFFILLKFLGFEIPKNIPKKEKLSPNELKFFIIVLAIYAVFLGYLLRDYAIASNQKAWYYVVFLILFTLGAKFIFLRSSFEPKKLLRPYNLGMYVIIFGILSYMGWNSYQEIQFQKEIQNNPYYWRGEPGIMSDEAYLSHIGLRQGVTATGRVSEYYSLTTGLGIGSVGDEVSKLKEVLKKLGYMSGELDNIFDYNTRMALRNALIEKCDWPETTKGIFGPLSKDCLDSQIISVTTHKEYIQRDQQIISDEVLLENLDEDIKF